MDDETVVGKAWKFGSTGVLRERSGWKERVVIGGVGWKERDCSSDYVVMYLPCARVCVCVCQGTYGAAQSIKLYALIL